MFGAGLNATELAELIERDLQLHVAFPCFPLDSSLGHTACSVVRSHLQSLIISFSGALCDHKN